MEESNNNIDIIAQLAEREGLSVEFLAEDKWMDVEIAEDFLDFTEPYRPPRYTLSREGVPFANVGELHIISGKPGNGKTGLMTILMAAILSGKYGKTEYALAERPTPVVLYIDTEQGKDDTIALKNRVCTMSKLDYTKDQPQLKIMRLRDTEDASMRWRKILRAVFEVKPTDIFLDGMLDIVKDYNDQVECQPVMRKCMMLANHYDCSMWMVLHENPMVDKLVGVLGSIAQRKVAEIFSVVKVKQSELKLSDRDINLPEIYFKVKQVKARNRDLKDWIFYFDPTAAGWGLPIEFIGDWAPETPDSKSDDEAPTKEFCEEKLKAVAPIDHISYTTLRERLKNLREPGEDHGMGSTKARNIIQYAVSYKILEQDGNKYWMDTDSIRFDEPQESDKDPF